MDNRSEPLARASAVATELASAQRSPRPSRDRIEQVVIHMWEATTAYLSAATYRR